MVHTILFNQELVEAALPYTQRTPVTQSGAGRSSLSSPATSHAHSWARSSPSPLILVIDDSATVRKILETCLRRAGYQTAIFADGVTALRWLLTPGVRLPDLVFLDIEMPKMDGYAVAQYLKARPQYRHLPIVMLTGRHGVLDRLKGRLAGAQHYLTKPFRTQSILAVVQAHLGSALALDAASIDRDTQVHTFRP